MNTCWPKSITFVSIAYRIASARASRWIRSVGPRKISQTMMAFIRSRSKPWNPTCTRCTEYGSTVPSFGTIFRTWKDISYVDVVIKQNVIFPREKQISGLNCFERKSLLDLKRELYLLYLTYLFLQKFFPLSTNIILLLIVIIFIRILFLLTSLI